MIIKKKLFGLQNEIHSVIYLFNPLNNRKFYMNFMGILYEIKALISVLYVLEIQQKNICVYLCEV